MNSQDATSLPVPSIANAPPETVASLSSNLEVSTAALFPTMYTAPPYPLVPSVALLPVKLDELIFKSSA